MGLYISGNYLKNCIKLAKLFTQSPLFSLYTQPAANVTFFPVFMFNVVVVVVVVLLLLFFFTEVQYCSEEMGE